MWPEKLVPVKSKTSEEEAKVIRELLSLPSEKPELEWNVFDELLECHDLRRALHIQAWVQHFTTHRVHKGPLTSEDIQETKNWWIKRFLSQDSQKPHFEQTRQEINLFQMQIEFSNAMEEFKENTLCACQQTPCLQENSCRGFMLKPYMGVCPLPWQRFVNSAGS